MLNQLVRHQGYQAGLEEKERIDCPYDGRTKEGKAWWVGFNEGNKERIAKKRVKVEKGLTIKQAQTVVKKLYTRDGHISLLLSEGYRLTTSAISNGVKGAYIEFLAYQKGTDRAVIQTQTIGNKEAFSVLFRS